VSTGRPSPSAPPRRPDPEPGAPAERRPETRGLRIEAVRGDITREHVDAIVNAANTLLVPGGGVSGAIHRAAGPALEGECRQVRRTIYPDGLPVGDAVATGAGMLPARWVIHTVGPDARRGQTDPTLLASCFVRSLREAADVGARSVAFPAVSGGIFGWDVRDVAHVAVDAVREVAAKGRAGTVGLVRFVLADDEALAAFRAELGEPPAS
jgi:O-acetyl-ADP-ribose deacetylase (regulator of RNase III)